MKLEEKNFKTQQLAFPRVANAYQNKWNELAKIITEITIDTSFSIYIRAFKNEQVLEVWLRPLQAKFQFFKTYAFSANTGVLGPKVFEGDLQIPEGFYKIDAFNPMSKFHLSLRINYPNKVDVTRTGSEKKPGGDIYLHGGASTKGCIPLTDDKIQEVYILAVEARNAGQDEIPVHIFPFRMTNENMLQYEMQFSEHRNFWKNLKEGYDHFENYKRLPEITESGGAYVIK